MRFWTRYKRFLAVAVGFVLVSACHPDALAQTEPLVIHAKTGAQIFQVELADTPEKAARGLMFRKSLSDAHGMFFIFPTTQELSFWMKNTMIPLDIIFIREDGTIGHIAKMAQPYDETPIPSHGLMRAVLEISGGQADKRGIAVGDRIESKSMPNGK